MRALRGLSLLAVGLAAALAAGCSHFPLDLNTDEGEPRQTEDAPQDLAEVRLAEAAARAEAALTALARIRAAENPPPAAVEVSLEVPPALRRAVTLDWIGPVETLAEILAARAGYRFVHAGPPPVRPVMVTIAAKHTPLIEVLRDAGIQAGAAATLTVDAERHIVRLDWATPGSEGA